MRLIEADGHYGIVPDDLEIFFQPLEYKAGVTKERPRILPFLAEWWDMTAPGQWNTGWVNSTRCIVVDDPKLFTLFKLAWQNREEITFTPGLELTGFYCPYIPLTITSAVQSDDET